MEFEGSDNDGGDSKQWKSKMVERRGMTKKWADLVLPLNDTSTGAIRAKSGMRVTPCFSKVQHKQCVGDQMTFLWLIEAALGWGGGEHFTFSFSLFSNKIYTFVSSFSGYHFAISLDSSKFLLMNELGNSEFNIWIWWERLPWTREFVHVGAGWYEMNGVICRAFVCVFSLFGSFPGVIK